VSGPLPIVNLPDEGSRITQVSSRDAKALPMTGTTDSNQQVMEMCKKLNARLDVLEKTVASKYSPLPAATLPAAPAPLLRETNAHPVAAPAVIVPTVTPVSPTTAPATSRMVDHPNSQGLQPCEICPINPTPPLLIK
jgi:hypothetical protein